MIGLVTEVMMRSAPIMAASKPVTSPTRRPRASANLASGKAATAAAKVNTVVMEPAQASEPDRSTASNDPMESVAPLPTPLSSCAELSRKTVRR
jgi:hypothetical protein